MMQGLVSVRQTSSSTSPASSQIAVSGAGLWPMLLTASRREPWTGLLVVPFTGWKGGGGTVGSLHGLTVR